MSRSIENVGQELCHLLAVPTFCTNVNGLLPRVFCQHARYEFPAALALASTIAVLQVRVDVKSHDTVAPAAYRVLEVQAV